MKKTFFKSSDIKNITETNFFVLFLLKFIKGNIYIDPPEYGKSTKTITIIKQLFGKFYVTEIKQIKIR